MLHKPISEPNKANGVILLVLFKRFYSLPLSNKFCKICKVNSCINKQFYNKYEVVRVNKAAGRVLQRGGPILQT